jgi:glycosyltransferase involved in cell wall biosynthesis
VPASLWDNAGPVAEEVLRIARERPVDAVFASIWDVEWVGVHAGTSLPIVCGYTTPFSVVRATQPDSIGLDTATADAIESLEAWAHRAAHAVQVNGEHVASSVAASSGVDFEPRARFVVPLGSGTAAGQDAEHSTERSAQGPTEVLFVGRLEPRKGADLLLAAVPRILAADGDVHLTVVGDDAIPGAGGVTMRVAFEAEHADLVRSGAVSFLGVVDDAQLQQLRRRADVAVLPSRFESFGLVYVEAMAHATPVVALRGSGADEVVVDGVTGVLCDEDPDALAAAVLALVADPAAARDMGEAGRARFEEHFTAEAMVDRFERLFASVRADRPGVAWAVDESQLVTLPDGSVGQLLGPGAVVELAVPPGRATVVVAGAGEPSSIELHVGSEVIGSPVADVEFRHLHLPAGATTAELRVAGDAAVVLAALVVVDPDP